MGVNEEIANLKARGYKWTPRKRADQNGSVFYVVAIGGKADCFEARGKDGGRLEYHYRSMAKRKAGLLNKEDAVYVEAAK